MSAAPENEELHYCPVCHKGYKRREHLQRHRSTHNADRPYSCNTCGAAFKRTDVLRRHMETCDGRRAQQGIAARKRRACDRCVRQKKACDAASPCQNCHKRGVPCEYSRPGLTAVPSPPTTISTEGGDSSTAAGLNWLPEDASNAPSASTSNTMMANVYDPSSHHSVAALPYGGDSWGALAQDTVSDFSLLDSHVVDMIDQEWSLFMGPTFGAVAAPQPVASAEEYQRPDTPTHEYSFRFLADFTSRTGLVSSFDCGSLAQRREVVTSYLQSTQGGANAAAPLLSPPQPVGFMADFRPSGGDMTLGSSLDFPAVAPGWQSWLNNPMVVKLQQIVLRIKEVVVVKPRNSTVTLSWVPAVEARCLDFFSVHRVGKFLELYWSIWHPNVNFLHRPTFDPTHTPSTLLAAMAIIGACVSPDANDNEDARVWFNCVEEMVFTDDHLSSDLVAADTDEYATASSVATTRQKLQVLQAACIVCLYQNWEGTDASKRRIRRYRFSTVVSVARDIGLPTARHAKYYNVADHEFSWQEYVAREELIRTFLWVMLIDTAFVIFNNLPSRMVIKELTMQMASPELCFQAPTAESCLTQVRQWMPDANALCHMTLREAIEDLCIKTLSAQEHQRMAELGPLNLFAIVSSFHYIIFQHNQNPTVVQGQLGPIENALSNWKSIWAAYCAHHPPTALHVDSGNANANAATMWKRIGFSRYCAEFWLLAALLLARISAASTHQHQLGQSDIGGEGSDLSRARIVEPVLDKYDQTSMRQVNDLITDFGKVQL